MENCMVILQKIKHKNTILSHNFTFDAYPEKIKGETQKVQFEYKTVDFLSKIFAFK